MKHLLSLTIFLLLTPTAYSKEDTGESLLNLHIKNIETDRGGQLIIFVFLEKGFPVEHDKAIRQKTIITKDTNIGITIEVPASSGFAIKVLHDEDMNNILTKNWTGIIPAEGLGFSNGARLNFGPPEFSEARINYSNKPHTIEMFY